MCLRWQSAWQSYVQCSGMCSPIISWLGSLMWAFTSSLWLDTVTYQWHVQPCVFNFVQLLHVATCGQLEYVCPWWLMHVTLYSTIQFLRLKQLLHVATCGQLECVCPWWLMQGGARKAQPGLVTFRLSWATSKWFKSSQECDSSQEMLRCRTSGDILP